MDAARPLPGPDAIHLLMADHYEIDERFGQYRRLREFAAEGVDQDDARERLALQICTMLVVHAAIEEAIFYPAARSRIDAPFLLEEAAVEHATVTTLIRQIRASRPGLPLYDARMEVLCQYVRHHVCEEENLVFPRVRRTTLDLHALGQRMREYRQALMVESTLPEQGELPA